MESIGDDDISWIEETNGRLFNSNEKVFTCTTLLGQLAMDTE